MKPLIKNLICLFVLCHTFISTSYYSQFEQDEFVNTHFFKNKRNGVFVDIGAHNGITYSNSYFFEQYLGWNGICVEPIPDVFDCLIQHRKCICVQGCVCNFTGDRKFLHIKSANPAIEMLSGLLNKYSPEHLIRIAREVTEYGGICNLINVQCYLFNDLVRTYGITHIDFLSIDTEGGEFDILESIDFSQVNIDVIAVEDNYKDPRFHTLLESKGYQCVKNLGCDLIFIRNYLCHTL